MPRWCYRCGDFVRVGEHGPDGRFDPYSVRVTDEEIIEGHFHGSAYRRGGRGLSQRQQRLSRYAIALGKHIGTRF